MMSRRRLLPVSLLAVLGLVFAACGDDDDIATSSEDTQPDVDADVDDADAPDEGLDEDAFSGDLGECGFFVEFATAFDEIDPASLFATGEEIDFGSFFGPLADEFEDVAAAAPDEIRDAFRTVADGFSDVAEELEGVVIDLSDPESIDPETTAKLEALESGFGAEFDAASEEIDAWMEANCPDFADELDLESFGR